ncbi:MAG: hypothetical protein E7448_02335 [Ruminococcaceae bacterium]|nr:hypothetical protein [Oscillospiraceae bacterium]
MKRFLACILALLMVLSMAACATPEDQTPATEVENVYAQQNYALRGVSNKLRLLGRASVANNGIASDHTASGIEFEAYIQGEFRFTVSCSADTYFTVFVDGERLEQRFEAKGEFVDREIVVGDLGELALRNIRIIKQTEAKNSVATLKSMEFYGCLADAPKQKDLYIEFIGDSITAGYGNLWTKDSPDPSNKSGTALYQDGILGYAFLTAQLLQADISVVSCSGIGIDRGYTNQNGKGYRMRDFYEMTSYVRSKTEVYDFENARVPDLVVINLGTNDQSVGSTEEDFKAGVRELINFIRTSYNSTMPIVWAYGMMSDGRYQWVEDVINELGGDKEGLYMCELIRNKEGGNGHPSLTAHSIASQQLAGFLTSNEIV